MIYLTGYHSTTKEAAKDILSNNEFILSTSDKEWLGNGIYFYKEYKDALEWNRDEHKSQADAILHGIICVNDDEYIDFDTENGKKQIRKIKENLIKDFKDTVKSISVQELQCLIANLTWDEYPQVKVLSASFHPDRSLLKTLIDERPFRKEFCVRDNKYIFGINEINVVPISKEWFRYG